MTIQKRFLHRTFFDKAAAYGFQICVYHPIVDSNTCIAFVVKDVFLMRNGWERQATEEDAYGTMMQLASGALSKNDLSA